jgi:uncharacterized protein
VIPATPEQQRALLALQQVDTAIRQLEHRRANLPEQQALDENADTLKRVSVEYANAKDELEQLEFKQKRLETEIGTVDSRRKSEEGRMYGGMISSDRELEALRNELSALRARKNDLEDDLIETMERVEELTSLVATLEERHGELTGQVNDLTAARDEAAKEIDGELTELRAQREASSAGLDAKLLTRYDQLRARGRGIGVAELSRRTCLGCNLDLTVIELEEVREEAKRGLPSCPQCDRLLVLSQAAPAEGPSDPA